MNRRSIALFSSLSLLIAALAAGSVAYRVAAAESAGKRNAQADFDRLAAELASVRTSADLADASLRGRLAAHYRASPSLLLVSIYERGSGLRWRMPDRSDYLLDSENQKPFPEPRYPERSSVLISAPIKGDVTGRLAVDALYSTLGQATVFTALRDAVLALAVYLALAAVILACSASSRRVAAPEPPAPKGYGAGLGADEPLGAAAPAPSASGGYAPPEEEFEVPEMSAFEPEAAAEAEAPRSGSPDASTPGLYSPDSGLGYEDYQAERLDAELARSASFEQDLSVLALSYDGLVRRSPAYGVLAKAIVDFFTFRDLAFERGDDGFSIILSNIDVDSALRMAEEFLKKLTFLLRDYREDPLEALPIFIGLSSRAGRLVDSARITQEAAAALQKAREDCDTHIVAFRPDADKYRLYLASKGC